MCAGKAEDTLPACKIRKSSILSFTFRLHSVTSDSSVPVSLGMSAALTLCHFGIPWIKQERHLFCGSVSYAESIGQQDESQGIHTDQPWPREMSSPSVCDTYAPPRGSSEPNAEI